MLCFRASRLRLKIASPSPRRAAAARGMGKRGTKNTHSTPWPRHGGLGVTPDLSCLRCARPSGAKKKVGGLPWAWGCCRQPFPRPRERKPTPRRTREEMEDMQCVFVSFPWLAWFLSPSSSTMHLYTLYAHVPPTLSLVLVARALQARGCLLLLPPQAVTFDGVASSLSLPSLSFGHRRRRRRRRVVVDDGGGGGCSCTGGGEGAGLLLAGWGGVGGGGARGGRGGGGGGGGGGSALEEGAEETQVRGRGGGSGAEEAFEDGVVGDQNAHLHLLVGQEAGGGRRGGGGGGGGGGGRGRGRRRGKEEGQALLDVGEAVRDVGQPGALLAQPAGELVLEVTVPRACFLLLFLLLLLSPPLSSCCCSWPSSSSSCVTTACCCSGAGAVFFSSFSFPSPSSSCRGKARELPGRCCCSLWGGSSVVVVEVEEEEEEG